MEFKELLLKQYKLYPKMQLKDMVKFIYQNEFAGGHMIADEEESLERLQKEYTSLKQYSHGDSIPEPFERIGNGLCRLHLKGLINSEIDIRTVNKFFIDTANSVRGDIGSFEAKLYILRQCCIDGYLPYSVEELDIYLNGYKSQGYPPVSHSEIYRDSYLPAYRIVREEYCHYFEVFERIDALMRSHDIVNVAIDGNAGAGKTTLSTLISNIYDCNIFHMDHFFLRPELRTEERLKEVGGNVDYVRFKQEIIEGLESGVGFKYQVYNCKKMALDEYITVKPKKLNIIEGVYSMHPTLVDSYDLKVFLEIDEKEQSRRILERNGIAMQRRFLEEWIPLENEYFDRLKIKEKSDLVIQSYIRKDMV